MGKELNCEQVMALITFYNENVLNSRLRECIENHLAKCKKCREAYAKSGYSKYLDDNNLGIKSFYSDKNYENLYKNLSAYMDNELNEKESMKIKKSVISNPIVREKFKGMCNTKLLLHSSFEKLKSECRQDYTSVIMNKLNENPQTDRNFDLYRTLGFFSATLTMIVIVLLTILYS